MARIPGTFKNQPEDLPSGWRRASTEMLVAHYGREVSATLRADNFPEEPQSFFVQRQSATLAGASPWETLAVYPTRKAADDAIARWEGNKPTQSTVTLATGEMKVDRQQPVALRRVVTLDELLREGPEALWQAFLCLATSDHEWVVSTEIGSAAKMALSG